MTPLYLDENMPSYLAKGFDILQKPEGFKTGIHIEVKHVKEVFGQGIKDEDWIPLLGKEQGCIITQDFNIYRRKHERALFEEFNLGIFFLRNNAKGKGMSIWKMVEMLAKYWPFISETIYKEQRPFAYELKPVGKPKKLSI
jgi:hypothetical protein